MKRYLVGGLVLVALCLCGFMCLTYAAPYSEDITFEDLVIGLATVGGAGVIFVVVMAWILGGCRLG